MHYFKYTENCLKFELSQDLSNYFIFFSIYNSLSYKSVLELEARGKLVFLYTREPNPKESGK